MTETERRRASETERRRATAQAHSDGLAVKCSVCGARPGAPCVATRWSDNGPPGSPLPPLREPCAATSRFLAITSRYHNESPMLRALFKLLSIFSLFSAASRDPAPWRRTASAGRA